MEWHIGQLIVAIKDSNCGNIKKGQEFTIKGLRGSFCNCKDVQIDVGIISPTTHSLCKRCNITHFNNGITWKKERLFAPLDFDISELTEILEQPLEYVEK